MKIKQIIFVLSIFPIIMACKEENNRQNNQNISKYKEPLIKINKYLSQTDIIRIKNYAKRRNWNLQESPIGFFYDIYKKGNGKKAEIDKYATVFYNLSTIDGSVCYTSDSLGSKTFVIGKRQVERGLEEAILLMKEGDKARIILPPFLALGLMGDGDKIPARAILVYDIELSKIF